MKTNSLFTKDNHKIAYDHYQAGNANLVIIAHGFFNSKDAVLFKKLAENLFKDYDVAVIDFRGHGKSSGLFYWTAKEYIDLIGLIEELRGGYERIGVIGFSLGAATGIISAARIAHIDSLIAVSAPTAFGKIEYRFWEMDIENDILYNLIGEGRVGKGVRPGPFWLKKEKPIDVIAHLKCPVLFIHGEVDWLIKPWHSQALYDKTPGKKKIAIIKNGPHAEYLLRKNYEETMMLIKEWFRETLGTNAA